MLWLMSLVQLSYPWKSNVFCLIKSIDICHWYIWDSIYAILVRISEDWGYSKSDEYQSPCGWKKTDHHQCCDRHHHHRWVSGTAQRWTWPRSSRPAPRPRCTPCGPDSRLKWRKLTLWLTLSSCWPTMTPYTLLIPASTMVASWDRSPHSAMKVIVRQLRKSW